MDTTEISSWIQGDQEYSEGLQLYIRHGGDEYLKKYLSQGPTSFRASKLLQVLEQIRADTIPPDPDHHFTHPAPSDDQPIPQVLHQKKVRKGHLYRQAGYKHNQLELYDTDDERLEAALLILDLWDGISQIWEELDFYEIHKVLMPEDSSRDWEPPQDQGELMMTRLRLRTYLSRTKGRADIQDKRDQWESKLKKIDKKIDTFHQ